MKDPSMKAAWYYIEEDEIVGPTSLEEVARQIRREGQPRVVWTEGMTEWTDTTAVPTLSTLFRKVMPQSSAKDSGRADSAEPLAPKQATLQHLRNELIKYLAISAYLFVCFGSLLFYKAAVLHTDGIAFASFGIAIVKALVLGKFILVLHALKVGERERGTSVLLAEILKKSVLFVVFVLALTVLEEIVVGYFHGK